MYLWLKEALEQFTPHVVVMLKRSDCILVYGSTTKGDVVKRSDCILVYGSTTKGDVEEV